MSEPSTPPVPPVPSPAEPQPAPRFGEFAPVETPAAETPAAAPAEPAPVASASGYTPPQYPTPAYPAQQYPAPQYPAAQAPAPQYPAASTPAPGAPAPGAYPPAGYPAPAAYPNASQQQAYPDPAQPVAPGYAQPGYGQPVYGQPGYGAPAAPRRRVWDVVLTIILLALGLLGVLGGIIYGVIFSSPELLDEVFRQQGFNGFNGEAGAGPAILIVSHVLLYLIAAGLSIVLLLKRKIAFYIPLIAGVVAAIIFWTVLTVIMMSDPAFMSQYGGV